MNVWVIVGIVVAMWISFWAGFIYSAVLAANGRGK